MGFAESLKSVKEKLGLIEQSAHNIPSPDMPNGSDIGEVFTQMLSPDHILQTANITGHQQVIISAWKAYNMVDSDEDVEKFSLFMVEYLLESSVSVGGWRAQQLHDVAVGQLSQEFQMRLAEIRNPSGKGNAELKDVI